MIENVRSLLLSSQGMAWPLEMKPVLPYMVNGEIVPTNDEALYNQTINDYFRTRGLINPAQAEAISMLNSVMTERVMGIATYDPNSMALYSVPEERLMSQMETADEALLNKMEQVVKIKKGIPLVTLPASVQLAISQNQLTISQETVAHAAAASAAVAKAEAEAEAKAKLIFETEIIVVVIVIIIAIIIAVVVM